MATGPHRHETDDLRQRVEALRTEFLDHFVRDCRERLARLVAEALGTAPRP